MISQGESSNAHGGLRCFAIPSLSPARVHARLRLRPRPPQGPGLGVLPVLLTFKHRESALEMETLSTQTPGHGMRNVGTVRVTLCSLSFPMALQLILSTRDLVDRGKR